MTEKLARFFKLRRFSSRIELALLDSMEILYGEALSEKILLEKSGQWKQRVLADLSSELLTTYDSIQADRSKERPRG